MSWSKSWANRTFLMVQWLRLHTFNAGAGIQFLVRELDPTVQFNLVTQSCLTLSDSMDCSTPDFPVHHQLPELTHPCPLSWWCHPTISSSVVPFSSRLQSFPASGFFLMSWFFASGGQRTGASASASVLSVNIQSWFSLGLTGLISKGLSRVFSNTTIWKHQFFHTQHPYGPTLTFVHDYWKNHSFD